jgi:predicted AlkP superfamily phosphohydrolase/phosphomutase
MTKVLVIGIDALDSVSLSQLESDLPTFSKLREESRDVQFDGVFPPDSPTSWGSIYTGLNPAKHGIVLFVDILSRTSTMVNKDVDDKTIRGKTFWDIASGMGKRVCILPHLLGYPPWSVNGVMVGRSGVTQKARVCPQSVSDDYDVSEFRWDLDLFPGREKDTYIHLTKQQIERETKLAMQLFKELEWDLFFVSFGELDPIQYSYWNSYDENDPTYRANNRYKNVIPDFYKLYDEIIARFLAATDADTTTIVVSDHGIGSRPVNLVNLNEALRKIGMITIQNGKKSATRSMSPSARLKLFILKAVDKYELGNIAAKALRVFPKGKDWIVSSHPIDRKNSIAYLTDQSGIKNYPYGGIQVNTENVKDGDYEQVRDSIIEALLKITDPGTGERVAKWAVKREELYEGAYIERYPDIVFELEDGYCAGMMTPAPMFGRSIMHNLSPGYHKQHHAVFLLSNVQERSISKKEATLTDVAPTILDLLSIDWRRYDFDGRSIFGK